MARRRMTPSRTEAYALDFMLAVLRFRDIRLRWVGFHQTTQTFGRYQALRHQGFSRGDALYHVLYD